MITGTSILKRLMPLARIAMSSLSPDIRPIDRSTPESVAIGMMKLKSDGSR